MSAHLKPAVSSTDHIQGNAGAPVEIVEYGDYQCPYCGAAYPVIKEIQKKFGNQVKFVFRNFPLSEIHEHANAAALAAEAANLQGKFWEMHDIIYEHQKHLNNDELLAMAKKIGLSISQFQHDIQSEALQQRIDADLESGMRSGVNGTPSFYVNGNKFDGGAEDLENMLLENAS